MARARDSDVDVTAVIPDREAYFQSTGVSIISDTRLTPSSSIVVITDKTNC